ncbi:carboxymuconolactone decarboxylase family protein [Prosthecomicrobium sp. N25]|uniref:carboxymuconolactone decarboxylase family protein n=1 Tax=Prosthecomicrobium sp. N25 TaxID=3129254 RepID=UPI003076EB8A
MARVAVINPQTATGEAKELLDAVQSGLGMVPNFIRVLANSPAALKAFLGIHGIAGAGQLDQKTRERIALAVAEQNACQYCVSAHTAIGRKVGLDNEEMLANRMGRSTDVKAEAALAFARALVQHTGQVSKLEIDNVRAAGHSDGEIIEIITHVAMNIFTNLLGKATQIDIDFPKIDLNKAT